jgi:hypothetical protein
VQPCGSIQFIDHLSAEDTNLIEFKQFIDGLWVAFFRRVQEPATLIHFLFFRMRGSSSLHAHPFRRITAKRGAQYSGNATIVLEQIIGLPLLTCLWSLFSHGYNPIPFVPTRFN